MAVIDDWQGRGLGGVLLRRLCRPRQGQRDRDLHRLAADREPQHVAPVQPPRPGRGARPRGRHDGDRRRAAGRGRAARCCAARRPGTYARRSGVFGLDNLPYGAIARAGGEPELVTRLGDHAVPLAPFERAAGLPEGTLSGPVLNPLLALGPDAWAALRGTLQERLEDPPELIPLAETEPRLPLAIGDYVDFYSSLEHASNLGRIFRPDSEPLLPNWRELPVGYHGRAGSVVVSGTPVRAPARPAPLRRAPDLRPQPRGSTSSSSSASSPARAGTHDLHLRGRRSRLRLRARQRLERARHPALGVRAARPVPGQVVRHLDRAVDRAAGGARALPRARPAPGPRAARVPAHRGRLGARHRRSRSS